MWCYIYVSLDSLCRWQVQLSIYCARRIPAHLRCTKCSIMLHLIDICFLPCIFLWKICLCVVSLDISRFYEEQFQTSSRSSWPAYQKNVNRAPIAGGGRFRHHLHRRLPNHIVYIGSFPFPTSCSSHSWVKISIYPFPFLPLSPYTVASTPPERNTFPVLLVNQRVYMKHTSTRIQAAPLTTVP